MPSLSYYISADNEFVLRKKMKITVLFKYHSYLRYTTTINYNRIFFIFTG